MATASLDRLELLIEGMTCASCAARVRRSLSGLDGVDGVSVNYATQTATVTFDGGRVDRARLVEAVRERGTGRGRPGRPRATPTSTRATASACGWRSRRC